MSNNHSTIQYFLDKAGIAVSAICVVHCLLLPVLLVVSPVLGASFLADEAFHRALLMLIIPASFLAFFLGCRRHKDPVVAGLAIAGLTSLIVAAVVGHEHGEHIEHVLTVLGSLIMVTAHIRNYRLCRHQDCQHEDGHDHHH